VHTKVHQSRWNVEVRERGRQEKIITREHYCVTKMHVKKAIGKGLGSPGEGPKEDEALRRREGSSEIGVKRRGGLSEHMKRTKGGGNEMNVFIGDFLKKERKEGISSKDLKEQRTGRGVMKLGKRVPMGVVLCGGMAVIKGGLSGKGGKEH